MQDVYIDSIQAFNEYNHQPTLHPMVSVVRVESAFKTQMGMTQTQTQWRAA